MKKIAVLSGKGGVGKSSVSVLISLILSKNKKVLLLDYDLCGPSCTRALDAKGFILKAEKGLKAIKINNNLSIISMGLMISDTDPVIWRGPKKISVLNLFYDSIDNYDYVVIDTPPGVSEEHGFLINKKIEAIIVTTSQNIALSDTVKAVDFCNNNGIPILGVIENMNSYVCSCCGEDNHPFAANGGKLLAREYNLEYLCGLSVDTKLSEFMDNGELRNKYEELQTTKILENIIYKL